MADKFPSIEELDGVVEANGSGPTNGDYTTGGDLLSRERATLGDEAAAQFASGEDHSTVIDNNQGDLLGGSSDGGFQSHDDDFSRAQSSFPNLDTGNDKMGPGGTITGSNLPYQPSTTQSYYGFADEEEEPEPIRKWRAQRDERIEMQEELALQKKEERQAKARRDTDDFYENYNNKKDKGTTRTRKEAEEFLANRQDTTAGGTSWDRVAKIVDLSGKGTKGGAAGTGKEKMRDMLLNLRKDENAPGAKGY